MIPEIGIMIQHYVRKKKRSVLMLIFSTVSQKLQIIKDVYSSLAKLKCETRTSLHALKYK